MNVFYPTPGNMTRQQVFRYRALVALQLRVSGMEYKHIAVVLSLRSKEHARQIAHKGRKLFKDCILDTML